MSSDSVNIELKNIFFYSINQNQIGAYMAISKIFEFSQKLMVMIFFIESLAFCKFSNHFLCFFALLSRKRFHVLFEC